MVDDEIILLKRARLMTKHAYQTRIRTGGSLVYPPKVGMPETPPPEIKPIIGLVTPNIVF